MKWDLYHKKLPRQDTMGVCICLIKMYTNEGREHASEKRACCFSIALGRSCCFLLEYALAKSMYACASDLMNRETDEGVNFGNVGTLPANCNISN